MKDTVLHYIEDVLANMPKDWLNLTTHRLDIYNEELAKTEFLDHFEMLYGASNAAADALAELPTAYDYIRLGHPLSTVLEWTIAHLNELATDAVISFSSKTTPILAVLRKNLFLKKNTQIVYVNELPSTFEAEMVKSIYAYQFEIKQVASIDAIPDFDGSTIFISNDTGLDQIALHDKVDFLLNMHGDLGSVMLVNGAQHKEYIAEIQHVRRRETIAMTPFNCYAVLNELLAKTKVDNGAGDQQQNKAEVIAAIQKVNGIQSKALVASSGLSMQYAIMMGLIDHALENHTGKAIKIVVPPNCYGGTNDQARRVAACRADVAVMDLPVDGANDMVQSVDLVLDQVAKEDAIAFIIAEIPTNPRVEVPDLVKLREVLSKERHTANGALAIAPIFILDQTFCPNFQFLTDNGVFSGVQAISYASGSKFPSGGKCTAGYCIANKEAVYLTEKIEQHLLLCDNEATDLQYFFLAQQMPSMIQRITDAYKNTRDFVNFIQETLPEAKINFVSEELAAAGFTPSVFSLDLPTKGNTAEERESYKRELNDTLINMMIDEIPAESKYCVSYGQLKGCYWTIPATSTQGTTKEADKDYIARVAVSPNLDLDRHKKVFKDFVESI